jgi:ATP-dependent exoDNAse (exonuclease V) alpha subunit
MKEYKFQNCTVRVHGTYDQEQLAKATEKYLKKVIRSKKNEKAKING